MSTAAGRGGIGVVRLSGSRKVAFRVLSRLAGLDDPEPRRAYFTSVRSVDGVAIDRGVVIWFQAPHSYTGEDVVEFQMHGNPLVLALVVKAALAAARDLGLRPAGPGEFTRRSFENGKIDLAAAESVMDLINASSESALRAAERSLSGEFSSLCRRAREELASLRVVVEGTLDFPEEDVDFLADARVAERLSAIGSLVEGTLAKARQGSILRDGLVVALAGSPNVGKSSLLNRLSGRDVAIVTEIPGTTRDLIESVVLLRGVQATLVDTAGIRKTESAVERAGIDRALAKLGKSDLVLHIVDAGGVGADIAAQEILGRVKKGAKVLTVANKCDLLPAVPPDTEDVIHVSAKTGLGIERLVDRMLEISGVDNSVGDVFSARERHVEALEGAAEAVDRASAIIAASDPALDMAAEELRAAEGFFGSILGESTPDDLLGRIFSSFCIGK